MKTKSSNFSGAKLALALLAVFACTGLTRAQGDSPDCNQMVQWHDKGCTLYTSCPPLLYECSQTNFTASCTGNYDIDAWTTCGVGNCGHCNACVAVYQSSSLLATCTTSACASLDCDNTCSGAVSLTADVSYTLVVCLTKCPGEPNCVACGEGMGCEAHGCVRYGQAATCYPQ